MEFIRMLCGDIFYFFFSSRRRHTRSDRDWSSDVCSSDLDGSRARRYLRTSPEFACKKLLAAGEQKIFEFARVFRDREGGDLHLPEFTMLEWYRANAPYDAIMADTIVVIAHAAQATGIGSFSFRGKICDPFAEPELLTVASAFDRFAGIDLLATIHGSEGDR